MMDDYGDEDMDMGMDEEDETSPEDVLLEAGFSQDQADAIVSAVRLCKSSGGGMSESEEAPKKSKAGSDALAILIGGPKGKK